MINLDGTGLEQISYDGVFDAFPIFSYDGKKIVFSSNRNNGGTRDTNLFVADLSGWRQILPLGHQVAATIPSQIYIIFIKAREKRRLIQRQ